MAADLDLACGRDQRARDAAQDRRLARAVRAAQRYALACDHVEIEIANDHLVAEGASQATDRQDWFVAGGWRHGAEP
jgi:hypothetical protein